MEPESSYEIFDAAIKQAIKKYWNMEYYEDLYQECYMKILDVLQNNTYEPVFNLYGYAYKIARNTVSTFVYHQKKLVTLTTDEFPDIPVQEDFEFNLILDEAFTQILNKYKDTLPKDFSKKDLHDLLVNDEPSSLLFTVIKGDLIWTLESYHRCNK